MRLPGILAIALAFMMALPAAAQTSTVQAGVYTDFRQLLSGEAPAATVGIAMTLRFPDERPNERKNRHPAIVIAHTIGGYQAANEGWHAEAFRKQGFATVTYPSMAVRRLVDGGGATAAWPSAVAEAYAAFRLLAEHPNIDADRIAILGFSFGGEVAYLAAFERLRATFLPTAARFAAHVAVYPAGVYGGVAEQGGFTGAPILMLLGEKDDNLPVSKVQDYLAYARKAGMPQPFELEIYPGAWHAWTVPGLGAPRFYPQYTSTRKCPSFVMGPSTTTLLVGGELTPIDPAIMQSCLSEGRGYTMAYDEAMRAKALDDTLAFLRRALKR
jgi:dienelactone hydrolase